MALKKLLVLTLGLALGLATPAFAAHVPEGVKLAADQTLRDLLPGDPGTFDLHQASDTNSGGSVGPTVETLVRKSGDNEFELRLAESYTTSEDGLTWTFKLRDSRWSDGKPIRAQDFVYAWRRLSDPKTASYNGDYLGNAFVVNATKIFRGEAPVDSLGVKALDDKTLEIKLEQPSPWLLSVFTSETTGPLRQDLVEGDPENWTKPGKLVSSGLWVLDTYARGDYITYKPNPYHYNAKNLTLTGLTYIFAKGAASYNRYLTEETHFGGFLPNQLEQVKKERPDEFVEVPEQGTSYWALNSKTVPKKARQALAWLADAKVVVEKITKSGKPSSVFAPFIAAENQLAKEADYYWQPLAERRKVGIKLLQEAGYTKENPLRLRFLTGTSSVSKQIFNAFNDFVDHGSGGLVKVELDANEDKVFFEKWKQKAFDVRASGTGVAYGHAHEYYKIFRCKDSSNTINYCNPEFDRIYEETARLPTADERAKGWAKLNEIILEDFPVLPAWHRLSRGLVSPAVGGYKHNSRYNHYEDYYIIADKHPLR